MLKRNNRVLPSIHWVVIQRGMKSCTHKLTFQHSRSSNLMETVQQRVCPVPISVCPWQPCTCHYLCAFVAAVTAQCSLYPLVTVRWLTYGKSEKHQIRGMLFVEFLRMSIAATHTRYHPLQHSFKGIFKCRSLCYNLLSVIGYFCRILAGYIAKTMVTMRLWIRSWKCPKVKVTILPAFGPSRPR